MFGSCARGDYDNESDIDLLILLDLDTDELSRARKRMRPIADKLDLQYDVVISSVFQNHKIFNEYKKASGFYQNIEREGIVIE
jgi:predicted nucleotidyltransferase